MSVVQQRLHRPRYSLAECRPSSAKPVLLISRFVPPGERSPACVRPPALLPVYGLTLRLPCPRRKTWNCWGYIRPKFVTVKSGLRQTSPGQHRVFLYILAEITILLSSCLSLGRPVTSLCSSCLLLLPFLSSPRSCQ